MFHKLRKWIPLIGILIFAVGVSACTGAPTTNSASASSQTTAANAEQAATAAPKTATEAVSNAKSAAAEATTVPSEAATEAPTEAATLPSVPGLSSNEVADLLHMREEEKLARDVYLALYDKWGLRVFQNIARAEQTHMDAVGDLLKTYGIPDPVAKTKDARGVFESPKLQDLYKQLVAQGSASEIEALKVGATIEDLDIKDLNEAISRTTHSDIQQVYENLKRGSENHMRAFMSNLRARGADYTPQYISEAEFQQILQGSNGRGQGHGQGHGQGRGQGCGGRMGSGKGQGGRWGMVTPSPKP